MIGSRFRNYSEPFVRICLPIAMWVGVSCIVHGQKPLSSAALADIVYLDSIVVRALHSDFSVVDFIGLVQDDDSFLEAFRNLKDVGYTFDTEMTFFTRTGRPVGSYQARHRQVLKDSCRQMIPITESWSGRIRKRRRDKYRYYTATMFKQLFLYEGIKCEGEQGSLQVEAASRGMQGHIQELKRLIFSPGSSSDVPLIGKKSEIFSEKMSDYYDFYIHSDSFNNHTQAYVFEVRLKDPLASDKNNQTVVKQLTTYFGKNDFQVLGRSYRLAHHTILYNFDVSMQIELTRVDELYLPARISYQGFWNIPTKKREDGAFTLRFYNVESGEGF